MKRYGIAVSLAVFCAVTACGSGGSSNSSNTVAQGGASGSGSGASTTSKAASALHVVESGFGQSKQYAWVTALVHNDGAKPGDFVVTNFNVKDASGQLIKSASQTEHFYKDGQDLALGTQVEVPDGKQIGSVEVTAATSNNMPVANTPELTTGPLTVTEGYGAFTGKFEVSNPTGDAVKGARIGVICRDASGKINGGGSSYPDLVPPNGKLMAESHIIASAQPASCKAYYGGKL